MNSTFNAIVKKLDKPCKIQDFLDKVPFNFGRTGLTYYPPPKVWQVQRANCFEGAVFAAWCLKQHRIKNYLMDLKVKNLKKDSDHTLCLFKLNGYWGAISKTNHSVLRWRDPIYRNPSELAFSYFHEYFLDNGEKTLKSFSKPFNVWWRFGVGWVWQDKELDWIAEALDRSPHQNFIPLKNRKFVRKAGWTEIKGAAITEWKKVI